MILYLSACAHLVKSAPTEENLRKAVTDLWNAKKDFEWGYVYDHSVNEYKKHMERKRFIRRANLTIRDFEIESVKLTGEGKAEVRVKHVVIVMGLEMTTTSTQEWLWEDGEWRLNLMPSLNSPFGSMIRKK